MISGRESQICGTPDRDKDRESERAMRKELSRLTSELKRTGDRLLECESKMKQDGLTLKRRNDDIVKLTKALRAAEGSV